MEHSLLISILIVYINVSYVLGALSFLIYTFKEIREEYIYLKLRYHCFAVIFSPITILLSLSFLIGIMIDELILRKIKNEEDIDK